MRETTPNTASAESAISARKSPVYIGAELHGRIKEKAALEGVSLNEFVDAALRPLADFATLARLFPAGSPRWPKPAGDRAAVYLAADLHRALKAGSARKGRHLYEILEARLSELCPASEALAA